MMDFWRFFTMDFSRKLSLLVFLACMLISMKNQREINSNGSKQKADRSSIEPSLPKSTLVQRNYQEYDDCYRATHESVRYDYYNESCPWAEQIIRSTVRESYELRPSIAPALLRLVFHDCFVGRCDASVLLDPADGIESERESPPNESLRGFDVINIIKSELEEACPGVVSCADIVVLAARESVFLVGGTFYPLYTGRKDSMVSFQDEATLGLPSPQDDLYKMMESFASRGFNERETVALLGGHSTGTTHCKFFSNRLYNFSGGEGPDRTIDSGFLGVLRSNCSGVCRSADLLASPSSSPSPSSTERISPTPPFEDPGVKMDYEGPGADFGTLYYRSLLQGKGLLFVDQQLTASIETEIWVRKYASDVSLFQRDFGRTMIKLSNLDVLTVPIGQVRLNCRSVNNKLS